MNNQPYYIVPVQYVPTNTYTAQWFTQLLTALPIIIAMISIMMKSFSEMREIWSKESGK